MPSSRSLRIACPRPATRVAAERLEPRRLFAGILLKDILPGAGVSTDDAGVPAYAPAKVGQRLIFAAQDAALQTDVWATDGSPEGTVKLLDLTPPGTRSHVGGVASAGGVGYFFAIRGTPAGATSQTALFRTDGTPAGTAEVAPVRFAFVNGRGYLEEPTASMNGILYFAGGPPAGTPGSAEAFGLMRTDGTAAGTYLVKDIVPGTADVVSSMTVVGDTIYFTVGNRFSGPNELWKTDGTEAGTVRVKGFSGTNGESLLADYLGAVGGRLFFRATGAEFRNPELWTSDGTEAGTVRVESFYSQLPTSGNLPLDYSIVDLNGVALFMGTNTLGQPQDAGELWRSDGTPAGTYRVKDATPGSGGSDLAYLHVVGNTLYYSARHRQADYELWKSDGTAAGTVQVIDLNPGTAGSGPAIGPPVEGQSLVYFTAFSGASGRELWATDGTAAGTRLVHDIVPGSGGSFVAFPTALAGGVFVRAYSPGIGDEPWLLAAPDQPAVFGRRVFYNDSAFDGRNPAVGAADDNAIAPDKFSLRPGATATFSNITSYSRGLNGVMIDVANLWPDPVADDFAFRVIQDAGAAGAPIAAAPLVSVRRGAGAGGSDRVTLTWPAGAVRNAWLEVTVKANGRTGLAVPDVFSFGNLVGETGDANATPGGPTPGAPSSWRVDAADVLAVRRAARSSQPGLSSRFDFNRDGVINVRDEVLARANLSKTLPPPAPPPANAASAPRGVTRRTRTAYGAADVLA